MILGAGHDHPGSRTIIVETAEVPCSLYSSWGVIAPSPTNAAKVIDDVQTIGDDLNDLVVEKGQTTAQLECFAVKEATDDSSNFLKDGLQVRIGFESVYITGTLILSC